MKLALIFLTVLASSVILVSMTSWSITYASSYSRVTAMATEFTQLARGAVDNFGDLVGGMIKDSGMVVNNVIHTEFVEGSNRIDQTEQQTRETTESLVTYARNATERSQEEIKGLVASFGGFMNIVIDDFEEVARGYASQLRLETALKTQTAITHMIQQRIDAIQRMAKLYELGLVNLTRDPRNPVLPQDCALLAILCAMSAELSHSGYLFMGTATGGHYSCNDGVFGRMLTRVPNGPTYDQLLMIWDSPPLAEGRRSGRPWMELCMEPPRLEPLDAGCATPWDCVCGYDVRCRPWYRNHVGKPPGLQITEPYIGIGDIATIHLSYPIYDRSSPPQLMAVTAADFILSSVSSFLVALPAPNSMRVAVINNDRRLTKIGDNANRAQAVWNETAGVQGPPNCTNLFLYGSCDPYLAELANVIGPGRERLVEHLTLELSGIVWDIFPTQLGAFAFFVVVGMNQSEVFAVITASQAEASARLWALRAQQLERLLAADALARAHMATLEEHTMAKLETMRRTLEFQLETLQLTSEAALNASQHRSERRLAILRGSQLRYVETLREQQLAILASNVGWTLAVVFGVLFFILAVGAYGTISVTRSLERIIRVMEYVAKMKIEALEIPHRSAVTEVDRIQKAFQVLVDRLSYYKSFMPAGLFQNLEGSQSEEKPFPLDKRTPSRNQIVPVGGDDATGMEEQFTGVVNQEEPRAARTVRTTTGAVTATLSPSSMTRPTLTKRSVAVLAVNVLDFKSHVFHSSEGHVEALLNEYIAVVHEHISKAKGNIDVVVGDQILGTFNAHIACTDPINAATNVALVLQQRLRALASPVNAQMALTTGRVIVGCSGYGPFKAMVTIGTPIKLASMLAHVGGFGDATVLVDPRIEERIKYSYVLRPVDLVYFPLLAKYTPALSGHVWVYALQAKKEMQDEEWLYQVGPGNSSDAWELAFSNVVAAETKEDALQCLQEYLLAHPEDRFALRLKARMDHWRPRCGTPLCEGPDPLQTPTANSESTTTSSQPRLEP